MKYKDALRTVYVLSYTKTGNPVLKQNHYAGRWIPDVYMNSFDCPEKAY